MVERREERETEGEGRKGKRSEAKGNAIGITEVVKKELSIKIIQRVSLEYRSPSTLRN